MSGFETKVALKNLGSNIIYLSIILMLLISIPILGFLASFMPMSEKIILTYFNRLQKLEDYIEKKLFWNGLFKFLMQ